MDYFVSNDLYEPAGAAEHYSEKLFQLRNLGSLAYYYRPERPAPTPSRAAFGISDQEHVYLCPQNLFKFHPDFDPLIAQILRRDPAGRLVAIAGRTEGWTERLMARWRAVFPEAIDRVLFLPRMNSVDYLGLIAVADVMLDTPHFNGMNTSLEAFALGTPVVTLPGALQRGRHTQAMYRKMGLADLVSHDAGAYIELALRLGTDRSFRDAVSARILASHSVLYEDASVISEFERFFEQARAESVTTIANRAPVPADSGR